MNYHLLNRKHSLYLILVFLVVIFLVGHFMPITTKVSAGGACDKTKYRVVLSEKDEFDQLIVSKDQPSNAKQIVGEGEACPDILIFRVNYKLYLW